MCLSAPLGVRVCRYLSSMNYSTAKLYQELPGEDRERVDELIKAVHRDEATEFVGPQGPPMSAFVAMVGTQVRQPEQASGRELVGNWGWVGRERVDAGRE